MMKKQAEALGWLNEVKSDAAFASDKFETTADAIAAVKRIYEAGARKVRVEFDEKDEIHTSRLIVLGTEESTQRIFSVIWSLNPDEIHFYRGDQSWKLWWD
jgi:hypothetical protein